MKHTIKVSFPDTFFYITEESDPCKANREHEKEFARPEVYNYIAAFHKKNETGGVVEMITILNMSALIDGMIST